MKRTLLTITALFAFGALSAQVCIPNPAYANEAFGIWPTAEEGFTVGTLNQLYNQVIDFKIPSDPNEIPDFGGGSIPPGVAIDSIHVVSVVGLPNGVSFECQSHTGAECTFLTNVQGCGLLTGVPTEAGTFPLTINVNAFIDLLGNAPFPFSYADFELIVNDPTSVNELAQYGMMLNQNAPNPFSDQTTIEFTLNQPVQMDFNIYNLLGKVVHAEQFSASVGANRIEVSASELNMAPGIYLYSLGVKGETVTRKMIVK